MPFTIPAGALAAALAPSRLWTPRVDVAMRGSSAWVDVTPHLRRMTWEENRDAGSATGQLTLRRDFASAGGLVSLAPLVQSPPLFNPFGMLRLSVAVHAPTAAPGPLVEVFRGTLDDPEWGGRESKMTVGFRDLAAALQDTIIRVERTYGSNAGVPILTVIQQILNDNGFTAAKYGADFAAAVIGNTEGWSLRPYKQARGVSVWDAIRALALQMGWDFRMWRHPDGAVRPTLLKPVRDVDTPDFAPTLAQFFDIASIKLNGADVRTGGELRYRDAAAGKVLSIFHEDVGAREAFGPRWFGLNEEAATNIDTEAEARQFLEAAVADLSTPYVEGNAVLPFLPWMQLGDVIQFPVVPELWDASPAFGVTGFRHELVVEAGRVKATTTPVLRGRPVGAYARWLALIRLNAITAEAAGKPAPIIGPLLGEASVENGDAVDGGVWLLFTMDKHTDALELFVAWHESSPNVGTVPLDDAHRAYIVRRMEGKIGSAPDWSSIAFLATNVDFYKRVRTRPVGYEQQTGDTVTLQARAVDGFEATLGLVTTVEVARVGADNVVTWEAEASESPFALFLIVYRNGFPLTLIPWSAQGEFVDEDVPGNVTYEYELQAFTHDGVKFCRSGPLKSKIRQGTGAPPTGPIPPTSETPPPGTPATAAGVPYLAVSQSRTPDGRDAIRVEATPRYAVPTTITVQRRTGAGAFADLFALGSQGSGSIVYVDDGVTSGTTYDYRARATVAGLTDSAWTATESATAAGAPDAPVVGAVGTYNGDGEPIIEVPYEVAPGTEVIRIFKASQSGSFASIYYGQPTGLHIDTGTLPGRTSRFYAVAYVAGRASPNSNIATATAPPLQA